MKESDKYPAWLLSLSNSSCTVFGRFCDRCADPSATSPLPSSTSWHCPPSEYLLTANANSSWSPVATSLTTKFSCQTGLWVVPHLLRCTTLASPPASLLL